MKDKNNIIITCTNREKISTYANNWYKKTRNDYNSNE